MPSSPPTKESGVQTDPDEIAPMSLFGLLIKEQEVETLAKAYQDVKAERDALLEALNAGNLGGETPEIRAWCGVVLANLERPE